MFKNNNTFAFLVGGGTALALAAGAMIGAPLLQASAQGLTTANSGAAGAALRTVLNQSSQAVAPAMTEHGRGPGGENATYLAEALGITVEELQTAQSAAFEQALQQAVKDGLITEAQAQTIRDRIAEKGAPPHGLGRFLGHGPQAAESSIDFDALLAKELGITTEQLQAARETARDKALAAAVANGDLTQEQANRMKVAQALRPYLDRGALMAQALGMSVEELQAAHEKGQTLPDLLEAQGLTQEQFQAAIEEARTAAVAQAVKDGVVTQAQADDFLANAPQKGPDGDFGPGGGHHGPHGGGFGPGGGGFGPLVPGDGWNTQPNPDAPTAPTSAGGGA